MREERRPHRRCAGTGGRPACHIRLQQRSSQCSGRCPEDSNNSRSRQSQSRNAAFHPFKHDFRRSYPRHQSNIRPGGVMNGGAMKYFKRLVSDLAWR